MEKICPNCGGKLEIDTKGSQRFEGGEVTDNMKDYLICLQCSWTDENEIMKDYDNIGDAK